MDNYNVYEKIKGKTFRNKIKGKRITVMIILKVFQETVSSIDNSFGKNGIKKVVYSVLQMVVVIYFIKVFEISNVDLYEN